MSDPKTYIPPGYAEDDDYTIYVRNKMSEDQCRCKTIPSHRPDPKTYVPSGYAEDDDYTIYARNKMANDQAIEDAYARTGDKQYLPDSDPQKYDWSSLGG